MVLRVVPSATLEGRVAGRVEVVDTGESVVIRSVDDLVLLLTRLAAEADEIK